jgi:Amt family ammonium transporter
MAIYENCAAAHSGSQELMMECVADGLENASQVYSLTYDQLLQWMLILAGGLVFFMQSGFAMLCAGAGMLIRGLFVRSVSTF